MLVLVTGGSSALAQTIAARIREQGHAVRLTDRAALPPAAPDIIHEDGANRMRTSVQQVQCALDADDATDALCDGVDQIVHVEPAVSAEDESWLDIATRCTYNLLRSAAAAGVSRATVLGSMDVFMRYDVHHGVMPDWQPRPSCSQPSALGPHMAEYVAREFALCSSVRILVARIGSLVHEAPAPGADGTRWWITGQEVAEELVAEMAADDSRADASSGVDLWSRNPFVRWNLARGGLDPLEAGLPWLAANGGTPTWHRPPAPILPEPRPAPPAGTKPVALLLGGSGMLGPSIVPVIDADFRVIITDVIDRPALRDEAQVMRWETANETTTAVAPAALDIDASKQGSHEWRSVDICNYDEVAAASSDTDVMMVLSVVRTHPKLSFDVNAQGVFNACKAAVANGHTRLINTGPWTVVAGHAKTFFHNVTEDMPAATGLDLYSFSKGVGHEISRCFTEQYPNFSVLTTLHGSFPDPDDGRAEHGTRKENAASDWIAGSGLPQPFSATFADSARAVAACLTVPLATLPSRHESFFIVGDFPDSVFSNAKAKRLLGWEPTDLLTPYFTRASL